MRRTDALIVGGGPAGAAAALHLAERGLHPLVVERSTTPQDALCGGFLSWTTLARLRALGVDPLALGGRPVQRVRLIAGRREATAALPRPAAALSRRTLDEALLSRAALAGAEIVRGRTARSIVEGAVRLDDATTLTAAHLLLATGKHELRGAGRVPRAARRMVGLRWRLAPTPRLDAAIAGTIELHLFAGGYAGVVRQEDSINLCLAIDRSRLSDEAGEPDRLLAALAAESPVLADRLAAAGTLSAPQATANVPYGWRATRGIEGAFRLGDQAAVIASLAGEGLAIALASGAAAANAIARGQTADAYQRAFAGTARRPMAAAGALWRLLERPRLAAGLVGAIDHLPAVIGASAWLTRL